MFFVKFIFSFIKSFFIFFINFFCKLLRLPTFNFLTQSQCTFPPVNLFFFISPVIFFRNVSSFSRLNLFSAFIFIRCYSMAFNNIFQLSSNFLFEKRFRDYQKDRMLKHSSFHVNLRNSLRGNVKVSNLVNFTNLGLNNNSIFQKSYENRTVFSSTTKVLNFSGSSQFNIDPVILNGNSTISRYLTQDSNLIFNFKALENFRDYLLLLGGNIKDPEQATKAQFATATVKAKKISKKFTRKERILYKEDSFKINNKFKRKRNKANELVLSTLTSSRISDATIKNVKGLLTQINYLLANRKSILRGDIRVDNLNLNKEIKLTLFSYSDPIGPYGSDTSLYTSDFFSSNRLNMVRRISLFSNSESISDLNSLKQKTGFLNFNVGTSEEFENAADIPLGGFFSGQFFFINPFLVLGFIFYALVELLLVLYFMSFILGNPYETFAFFFKYPLVYYYENLADFPSANYFFFSLSFWFIVIIMFSNYIFELIDEERFSPPRLSWLFYFLKEFAHDFIFLWCIIFCIVETLMFIDLLATRIFFIGTPGYPQLVTSIFLAMYEIFCIIGTTGYFSLFIENFIHFDIKFPIFYFSDFTPLVQRYPLVQPFYLTNFMFDRPNFFLWLFDSLVNKISIETSKSFFFSNDYRIIFQRELIQDIRKYNYVRKYLTDLRLVGQLYLRGWNGYNYRLDLKFINDPIISTEQVIRFDWRFKNSHFDGLNSRLFRPDLFGSDIERSYPMFKKLTYMKHYLQAYPSRYGYLEYLNSDEQKVSWLVPSKEKKRRRAYQNALLKKANVLSTIPNFQRQYQRLVFNQKHFTSPEKSSRSLFLFSPSTYKFFKMKDLNRLIPSKTYRNFRNSRLFLNIWSYFPGNTKPRLTFRYRSFLPLQTFTKVFSPNYLAARSFLNEVYFRPKSFYQKLPMQTFFPDSKKMRISFLNDPHFLFSNKLINQKNLVLNQEHEEKNSNKVSLQQPNILTKGKKQHLFSSKLVKFQSPNKVSFKQNQKKFHFPWQTASNLVPLRELPNYPYKTTGRKFHSIAWFFLNVKPFYILRPTSSFTTFSRLELLFGSQQEKYQFLNYDLKTNLLSGNFYPLGLFFLGFGKFSKYGVRFFSFDYYSQNYNFFYSFIDLFFKKDQFLTIPNNIGRFNHPVNGGIKHNLDFMYPMISELRIKEKFIPLNFAYESITINYWNKLNFDPYSSIRNAKFSKGSCYFLDARIQNWFALYNVIWNDYYHFFFNRSFKTEGNGSKFCLASFNPLNGLYSYKLFIDSPTLELSHTGQYFYNYIPWLQYKFRWLLYPTSTYKRFDSFRFIQQHSSKKFYFSSLLKFYQTNLFRWQQAATIFNYHQAHSRNFFVHLFFHKYKMLSDLNNIRELFFQVFNTKILSTFNPSLFKSNKIVFPGIDKFNDSFLLSSSPEKFPTITFSSDIFQLFLPFFTSFDFRFFQYSIDFRRWKSLQTNYLRDWKFENYIKYLGPLLYKYDTPSLMGFFAPFEYRNQIFVSKMRNDALRFSIFFPKKIIDEENPFLSNPRFPRASPLERGPRKPLFPATYAFALNKLFIMNQSNYSYFLKLRSDNRQKLILRGLHSHLERINLNKKFNLNYGSSFSEQIFHELSNVFSDLFYGFDSFTDLNSKKIRIIKDKLFWLSRTSELKKIGYDAKKAIFSKNQLENIKISKFSLANLGSQFGKPLDTSIPILPTKVEFFERLPFILNSKKSLNNEFDSKKKELLYSDLLEIFPFLNPTTYQTFGGPKALSHRWHLGQSWLKFVVASQNTNSQLGTGFDGFGNKEEEFIKFGNSSPYGPFYELARGELISEQKEGNYENLSDPYKTLSTFDNKSFFSNSLNGKTQPPRFLIPDNSGYFNFGLSGIGRLPRLSRSFFHMLFSRNKLEDFSKLKIYYLRLFLMSIPLFQNTDFAFNSSFQLLWKSLFRSKYLSQFDTFRYNILFSFFALYKFYPEFYNFIYKSDIGILFDGSFTNFNSSLILTNQYNILKSYNRFSFFSTNFSQLNYLNLNSSFFLNSSNINSNYTFFKNKKLRINSFFSSVDRILYHSFLNFHIAFSEMYLLYVLPFRVFFNFLKFFISKDFLFLIFSDTKIFSSRTGNHLLFSSKQRKSNFFLLNNSFLNFNFYEPFYLSKKSLNIAYSFFNNVDDLFRLRIYYGSFRSNIHWYVYPVHFFFSVKYILTMPVINFFFNLMAISLNNFFKYNSIIESFFFQRIFFDFMVNGQTFFSKIDRSFFPINLAQSCVFFYPSSYFFNQILFFNTNLYSFNKFNQHIKLTYRISNLNVFNSFYTFRNLPTDVNKFFITYNTFFFSSSIFKFLSAYNTFLNFNLQFSNFSYSNFISNSEFFIDNLSYQSRSLDGSGRYNRPRGFSYTMDRIFTYREFEKYRKEHHRQRFRAISPHWIQNSLKNRHNFTHFYSSFERKQKNFLKRFNTIRMYRSIYNRSRSSPSFTGRISALNYFSDPFILNQIFKYQSNLNLSPLLKNKSQIIDTNQIGKESNFFIKKQNLDLTNFAVKRKDAFYLNQQYLEDSLLNGDLIERSKPFVTTDDTRFFENKELLKELKLLNFRKFKSNFLNFEIPEDQFFKKFNILNAFEEFSKSKRSKKFLEFQQEKVTFKEEEEEEEISSFPFESDLVINEEFDKFSSYFEYSLFSPMTNFSNTKKEPLLSLIDKIRTSKFLSDVNSIDVYSTFDKSSSNTFENKLNSKSLKKLSNKIFFHPDMLYTISPKPRSISSFFLLTINKPNLFNFSKMFPPSSNYSLGRTYLDERRSKSQKVVWHSSGLLNLLEEKVKNSNYRFLKSFFPTHNSIKHEAENSRFIQPRFYRSILNRSYDSSIHPGIGGTFLFNKSAPYKHALFSFSKETDLEKLHKLKVPTRNLIQKSDNTFSRLNDDTSSVVHLPSNVRRFLRPYNKVLMQMPFLYSKWFTQNPRLSFGVNDEFLSIFVNNTYDEFNQICTQSLFLLKRKIMYNVINLKLVSYKNKLLYFQTFNNESNNLFEMNFLNQTTNIFVSLKYFYFRLIKFFILKLYFLNIIFNYFNFESILSFFYQYYNTWSEFFFNNNFVYLRLLSNESILKFKHDVYSKNDALFLDDFYYNYAAKRVLAQIGISLSSIQGWNNPLGIFGQYVPGLNFYAKFPFNFSYQYPDFFSGRSFSSEVLLLNNLYRQNSHFAARELFFGEYPIDFNYRPSWHFLSFRIASPVSPFIEHELPHFRAFSRPFKQRNWRLPMLSLRRINNIYPSHLSSFFSALVSEPYTIIGHDVTLPLKLKFLNFNFRQEPHYRRRLERLFKINSENLLSYLDLFFTSLNLKQIQVISELNKKLNFSKLVNNRRFSLRIKQWSPIHYNFYYLYNWKTFLHKFFEADEIGKRNYKLNSYFDLYQGFVPITLKSKVLQHLAISQIPRLEIDSRRRVPTRLPLKDFAILLFSYFNYTNENFSDPGYFSKQNKILRYVNRKIYPYLTFLLPSKNDSYPFFVDLGLSYKNKKRILTMNSSYFTIRKAKFRSTSLFSVSKLSKIKDLSIFSNSYKIEQLIRLQTKRSQSQERKLQLYLFNKFFNNKPKSYLFNKFYKYKSQLYLFNKFSKYDTYIPSILRFNKFKLSVFSYFFPLKYSLNSNILTLFRKFTYKSLMYWFQQVPFNFGTSSNFGFWFYNVKNSRLSRFFGIDFHSKTRYSFRILKPIYRKKRLFSRILSIYQLFELKRRKERSLNPIKWLSFDLFSRVRPSLRPFLFKFSKSFFFSKFIPVKGLSSYNFQIKSHSRYDNFFDRHPYISFGIGSFNKNNLLSGESAYKEIRKRSHILDLSKRLRFSMSPVSFLNPRFKFSLFNYKEKDERLRFMSVPFGSGQISVTFGSPFGISKLVTPKYDFQIGKKEDEGEGENPLGSENTFINSSQSHSFPAELSDSSETNYDFYNRRGLSFYPSVVFSIQQRRMFNYRFNNFYKNSITQSFSVYPERKGLLLNTQLLRPYTAFLRYNRYDNSNLKELKFLLKGFSVINSLLDSSRNIMFRAYYQPNLKVFFDFNAYKQRYNLSLLFRELSFNEDFQLFLFRKKQFFLDSNTTNNFKTDIDYLFEFTVFKLMDYFQFFIASQNMVVDTKYFVSSKIQVLYSQIEYFFLKLNISYFCLTLVDFFIGFFFTFLMFVKYMAFFDFSFFFNFFLWNSDFLNYRPNRSLFQLFFHLSMLREYLKFSWLFSLKFLIFTFDYYLYYFIFFWFLLVSRAISLKIRRFNFVSPFLVPYSNRFSDFKLNNYNGWFENAWKEVQDESIERLNFVTHGNDIKFSYVFPVSSIDIDQIKKVYKIAQQKNIEDAKGDTIDFQRLNKTKNTLWVPTAFLKLKNLSSKIGSLNFFVSYFFSRPSENFGSEDFVSNLTASNRSTITATASKLAKENEKEDIFRNFPRSKSFSFFILRKIVKLLLTRKIKFVDFIRIFNFGGMSSSYVNQYNVEDFHTDFDNLFLNSEVYFNKILNQNLQHHRMVPEDENIHFYRKPSFYVDPKKMNQLGTESDQFHYILEFPGKFNTTHMNSFSKLYSVRNLNYNASQFGFFSFSRNANLPTTFNEFLLFFSLNPNSVIKQTTNPLFLENLSRYYNLWSLFQHVIRYDYNVASYYNIEDVRLKKSKLFLNLIEERNSLFENLKFWLNRASNDALDFNIFNPNFYDAHSHDSIEYQNNILLDSLGLSSNLQRYSSTSILDKTFRPRLISPYDKSDIFPYTGQEGRTDLFSKFLFSFLYLFYIYLFLFVYFLVLVILFCIIFLFFFSFYNYLNVFF